jgi:hypothetical protein
MLLLQRTQTKIWGHVSILCKFLVLSFSLRKSQKKLWLFPLTQDFHVHVNKSEAENSQLVINMPFRLNCKLNEILKLMMLEI